MRSALRFLGEMLNTTILKVERFRNRPLYKINAYSYRKYLVIRRNGGGRTNVVEMAVPSLVLLGGGMINPSQQ